MSTIAAAPAAEPKPLYTSLFVQVLAALILGIILGVAAPDFAISLKILSDAFLKLISMIVAPIVFCVVVHGIAGAGDLKKVGRVGVKALVYFEVMTTVALVVGLILAYTFGPGHGMNIDPSTLDAKALNTYADNAHKLQGGGIGSFLLNVIPSTSFDALSRNDVLQVLFFAVLFGVGLALVGGEKGKLVTSMIDAASTVLFRVMGLIVRVAPLGVLGAVAYTVGKYGVGSLKQLVSLVALFYFSVGIFVLGVLGGVMALAGINILKFLAYLREELTIVLATASSDAVLPQIMKKLERMGVKDSVVGLVIPTGYSFNLDAFSIYLTLAVVFIAQATNTPLSFGDLLLVLGVSLITSKGAHGVPGSAIVILAATLNAVPSIPAIGLVLVLSVDWFIGMARAVGNLTGNCVATVVVAAWEGDLDRAKAAKVLDGGELVDVTAG
ncbi:MULTISPECIES: dicarboxylate/amino acid:cation symporter [unclassified Bradyrhizobium]|uniref:dicarboxylate/amino acid:cation symporter n=1 Tax=unclassified Bradyrhizobium TaxID=2631580 RepID=UPI001FFB4DE6|nr:MULTISPECIES: dicarboxylate/amino acid:cation symporter [unclassified Bradyrhizobium]MCK1329450.1 dicarboxylate/amino acid:cation symporter [Bradyrhizobium sp. CW9]MCK1416681.1 dicarboxylate/amino acid:cation symporter [Bradyrhizobium sp. CW4]UPJ98121.1 dicarboxylate/amino acid:cation symporter [Bradyrhizobium sp. 172]